MDQNRKKKVAVWWLPGLLGLLAFANGCSSNPRRNRTVVSENKIPCEFQCAEVRRVGPAGMIAGGDRLYLVGDQWLARRESKSEPVWLTSASRRLLVGDETTGEISYQPAPLSQELQAELNRLKELAERNRKAMEQMNETSTKLAMAAKELMERNRTLLEELLKAKERQEEEAAP